MYYWIAYDIAGNRTRRLAAKWCKQAGLLRLQRSVFTGRSDAGRIRELETNLKPLLSPKDRFLILPMDKSAWENLLLLGDHPSKTWLNRSEPFKYF
ncbi:MAG: CRISPR-associated endonuclease Cas2 [Haliscomenobacteraceae bacterium CHB4]|nr:CRISPR-associated endonuclease Cas2 [Haliscomenobacteraceae bacterium CHB4]